MKIAITLLLFVTLQIVSRAGAETETAVDADSDLIPVDLPQIKAAENPAPAPQSRLSQTLLMENAYSAWNLRHDLIVPTPVASPRSQNRVSLDGRFEYRLNASSKLILSDRLSAYAGDGVEWNKPGAARNDFREAYASIEAADGFYFEVGRVNERFGSAYGFNPTDFFKARTLVDLSSIDPSSLKENRLGVGVVSAQKLFKGGSIQLIYAPRLQSLSAGSGLSQDAPTAFDPLWGQTNSTDRFLAAFSFEINGSNTQTLVFRDDIGTHLGLNVSYLLTKSTVFYADWAGVEAQNLSQRALSFGQRTGALPQGIPAAPQSDTSAFFQNDLAVGFSWSSEYKFSTNLEYHYHQAGLSNDDLSNWMAIGQSNAASARQVWFVRQFSAYEQEPLVQRQIFLRFEKQDAGFKYVNAGVVAFVNAVDASCFTQFYANYLFDDQWTVALYITGAWGRRSSEKGSLPWSESGVFQIKRYF